jgi:putative transposase
MWVHGRTAARGRARWPTVGQRACARSGGFSTSRAMKPAPGYESLRSHRVSISGASYFVTLCTNERREGLTAGIVANAISGELIAMQRDEAFTPRSWVIMPDHLHVFFRLTEKLALGQVVGRLKSKTRRYLGGSGLAWQGNYFEHRLRSDDPIEDVLRYLFLNPYRSGLLARSAKYPLFWLGETDAAWFVPTLEDERPFPSWLATQ